MGPHRIFEQSEPVMPPTAKFLQHAGMVRRRRIVLFVMAGHSRPKDGVACARLCPAIHVFLAVTPVKTWMPGTSSAKTRFALLPGHDEF